MNTWWNAINSALILLLIFWIHIGSSLNSIAIDKVETLEIKMEERNRIQKDSIVVNVINNIDFPKEVKVNKTFQYK